LILFSRIPGPSNSLASLISYAHGIPGKAPSLLTVGKRLKREAIEKQIHDGGQNMPPFGDALQPDEITALVNMLAKQKKAPKHMPPPVPTPTKPDLK
jgi:mono/diheme cytochrome c family protein